MIICKSTHEYGSTFFDSRVVNNLTELQVQSQVIITDRVSADLEDCMDKVYGRFVQERLMMGGYICG